LRKTKGAVKLHAMIDLRGNIPAFLTITDGKLHDVKAAAQAPIEAEGIYVLDGGHVDFAWLWLIHQTPAFFKALLKNLHQMDPRHFSVMRGQALTCAWT
jgi:hypothetical protein